MTVRAEAALKRIVTQLCPFQLRILAASRRIYRDHEGSFVLKRRGGCMHVEKE